MTTVLILFAAGAILLGLEILVPGAVLGIVGGTSLLAGVVVAFSQFGGEGGAIALLVAVLLVAAVVYVELVFLPKSRVVKAFSMSSTMAGQSQPAIADRSIIGRSATAVTSLSPTGIVEADGKRYEAFSRDGFKAAGATLRVVDMDNFRLVVSNPDSSALKS